MLTRLRNKVILWTVVTAVIGAAYMYLQDPLKMGREKDHTLMTVTVTFLPTPRAEKITLTIRFNGHNEFVEYCQESPCIEPVMAPVGTLVTAVAHQKLEGMMMCSIKSKGVTYGPNGAKTSPTGGSACTVMATA
jgi:hypothetical protein